MNIPTWQLAHPIDAVIFDCDGTLSSIEGVDELANNNDVFHIVQELTQEAMGKSGMRPDIYEKRLQLVNPTYEQVIDLSKQYKQFIVPDAYEAIQLLKHLHKTIYIVSAGLFPAVAMFAELLNIDKNNVYAVDIQFDAQGRYVDFDRASSLISKNGKRGVVASLTNRHTSTAYIGDGLSDYEVYDMVTRFIGYGGAYYRKNIAELCEFYLTSTSMAPILPLLLTEDEYQQLTSAHKALYEKGLAIIKKN